MPYAKAKQSAVAAKRAIAAKERMQFLQLIEANYTELDGKFDSVHTKETRDECWKAIAATIIGDGLSTLWGPLKDEEIEQAKTGDPKVLRKVIVHLRDNKWSDLRRRYTRNRDRLSKTGEGGGAAAHLDEQDLLVERIVTGPNGEGRAAVSGLDVLSDGCSANGDAVDPSVANGTCKSSPSNAVIVEDDAKDESDKADGPERPSPPNLSVDCDKGILKETRKKRGKRVTAGNADANDDLKAARIEYIKQKTRFYELSCAKLLADLGHHQRIDESTEGRG